MGPEEMEAQRQDLERIACFTEKLAELDTAREEPARMSFSPGENRLREDEVTNEDQAERWTGAAPDSKGSYFRVPRTIEE